MHVYKSHDAPDSLPSRLLTYYQLESRLPIVMVASNHTKNSLVKSHDSRTMMQQYTRLQKSTV
jgi:hypothetical protein